MLAAESTESPMHFGDQVKSPKPASLYSRLNNPINLSRSIKSYAMTNVYYKGGQIHCDTAAIWAHILAAIKPCSNLLLYFSFQCLAICDWQKQ